MVVKARIDPAWHRYEFNPDTPQPRLPTCPERPYAWREEPPNPSVVERRGEELFFNSRRILIHEMVATPLTFAGVRKQLHGRTTPDESLSVFLREHKWLVPEPLLRRELIFFGSARQYESCATVSCLVVGASVVSSRYCSLDQPWSDRCAALYLEDITVQ